HALGLRHVQWTDLPNGQTDERWQVLAHHLGRLDGRLDVLDLQQFHAVEVDDRVHPGDRVGVRVAGGAGAVPDVAPADAPPAVALGHERGAVRPDVDEHEVEVGDA